MRIRAGGARNAPADGGLRGAPVRHPSLRETGVPWRGSGEIETSIPAHFERVAADQPDAAAVVAGARILPVLPRARLSIAGDGPARTDLEAPVQALRCTGCPIYPWSTRKI